MANEFLFNVLNRLVKIAISDFLAIKYGLRETLKPV